MARTTFSGPVACGTVRYPGVTDGPANVGLVALSQTGTITQNSTNAVSLTFTLPANSQIVDIIADTNTAWDSATSATLTVGTAAAGTQYASGVDAKSATARQRPAFTTAQLTAMANIGTNTSVVATITPVGATTAGVTRVTLLYVQN